MFFGDARYMLWVMLPTLVLTLYARWRVESAYRRYSQVPSQRGLTGLDTARILMQRQGLQEVSVEQIPGQMTDHYDPRDKTMRLSQSSIGNSVAAMAIVAHELGHAEQDKTGNAMLNLRASLVPVANIGSGLGVWAIILGMALNWYPVALLGVLLFGAMVAFTLITLPVEFDASRRAKRHLAAAGLVTPEESRGVDAVLDAAALTYVAAAAGAVLQLLYWVSALSGRSRD